ncbi:MAG: O-antigen ligase family protein [Solirubrobacterales bacterium]
MKAEAMVPTVAKLARHSSRGAGSVGRWIDAGRSSVVLALGMALAIPTVNVVPFDGLPLDRPAEIVALVALLPFLFSSSLRATVGDLLRRRTRWGPRAVLIATAIAIAIKVALLIGGTDSGFVACYSSTWKPAPSRCEESYSNLLQRHDGATRIDQEIDFGPTPDRASALVRTYSTLTYERGIAATDWNLSFSNDLRFNQGRQAGLSLHELMPFAVTWRGTAKIPADGLLRIRYRGQGAFEIGGTRIKLPPSNGPRTIVARVPAGEQPLLGSFAFPQRAAEAELRLLSRDGDPIAAAGPASGERIAAAALSLILAALFLGLLVIALVSLRGDLWLLGLVAVAALAVVVLSSSQQQSGFQYLVALLAPIMLLRLPRRPILWAFAALLVVEGAAVLNSVSDLHAVLYRASGTDFLTYESFARRIVLDHALNGGEAVFFYQPGSRYASGFMHLLFGDGDVLINWWWMVALNLPFLGLLAWNRQRAGSSLAVLAMAAVGFLLLALLNSETIVSLVAMGASEVPTWVLLPFAVAAPQLQPKRATAWAGSAVAASLIYLVRTNQALGVLTILAAIAASLWRWRRRLLWPIAGLALVVALLPTIHNLAYGEVLVLTTTSAALTQEVQVTELFHAFSDDKLGGLIRGHLSAILYNPPTDGLTHQNLAWLLWGLLGLWLTAVAVGVARLRRGTATLSEWLLLGLPFAYLFPHLLYQVEVYFPRHIIVGYLAMGASAIGVLSRVSLGGVWAFSTPRPIAAAAASAAAGARRAPGAVASWLRALGRALLWVPRSIARAVLALLPRESREHFGATWAGLVAAAFLAPFSATQIAGPLTLGRLALLVFGATLAIDLLRERPRHVRPSLPAVLLVASYVGLVGWILLSSRTGGCNCDGKAGGFFEFAAIGVLALVAIGFEPKLRGPALIATLAGVGLASTLALAGVGAINSGTVDLTQTGGRLSGTFGNANELGFAAALGLPIAVAYLTLPGRGARIAAGGATLILLATLVLTFSRGAIIAAAVGAVVVALWQVRGSRRRVAMVLAAAAVAVLIGGALYAVFEQERRDVSFDSVSPALRGLDQRDLSGWDSRALGPIPNGPSTLSNQGAAIAVRANRADEGASFRWGEASAGDTYTLRFRARANRDGLPFDYSLGDSLHEARGPVAAAKLDRRWRPFRLEWSPAQRSAHASLYLWAGAAPASISLADVEVIVREPGAPPRAIAVPDQLEGSLYDRLSSKSTREEGRYIDSRLDAARLAWRAFRAEPLRGIGWSSFPDYSEAHLDYGQLAAHNQYLAIAAELGLVGLGLLGLLIAAVVLGVRRSGPSRAEAAAIGVLAAAAAGLVFVEALPVPQLSISIAIAAAIVCGRRRGGEGAS